MVTLTANDADCKSYSEITGNTGNSESILRDNDGQPDRSTTARSGASATPKTVPAQADNSKPDPKDPGTTSNGEDKASDARNREILANLAMICTAGNSGDEKRKAFEFLKGVTGREKLTAMESLRGEELIKALAAFHLIDEMNQSLHLKASRIVLSGDSLTAFVSGGLKLMNANAGRRFLGSFVEMLPKDARNIDFLARKIGCGKKEIYRGISELKQYGLTGHLEDTNEPGAGRPGKGEVFENYIIPDCLADGRTLEDIIQRQQEQANVRADALRCEPASNGIIVTDGSEDVKDTPAVTETAAENTADKTVSVPAPDAAGADQKEKEKQEKGEGKKAGSKEGGKEAIVIEYSEVSQEDLQRQISELKEYAARFLEETETGHLHGQWQTVKKFTKAQKFLKEMLKQFARIMSALPVPVPDETGQTAAAAKDARATDAAENAVSVRNSSAENGEKTPEEKAGGEALSATDRIYLPTERRVLMSAAVTLETMVKDFFNLLNQSYETEPDLDLCLRLAKLRDAFHLYDYREKTGRLMSTYYRLDRERRDSKTSTILNAPDNSARRTPSGVTPQCRDRLLADARTAQKCLNAVTGWLDTALTEMAGKKDRTFAGRKDIVDAKDYLTALGTFISDEVFNGQSCAYSDSMACMSVIVGQVYWTYWEWKDIWEKKGTRYQAAQKISRSVLSSTGLRPRVAGLQKEYSTLLVKHTAVSQTKEGAAGDAGGKQEISDPDKGSVKAGSITGSTEADASAPVLSPEEVEEIKKTYEEASLQCRETRNVCSTLIDTLNSGLLMKRQWKKEKPEGTDTPKKSVEEIVSEAVQLLEGERTQIEGMASIAAAHREDNLDVQKAVRTTAVRLRGKLLAWLGKWEKTESGYVVKYGPVPSCATSVVSQRTANELKKIWREHDSAIKRALHTEDDKDPYVSADTFGQSRRWAEGDSVLSTEGRIRLIHRLWEEGKDPTDIVTWIDYILQTEGERYGSACDQQMCASITIADLQKVLRYFTGFECSEGTLRTILFRKMKYSRKQNAKLKQVGKPHPLRDKQYQHIRRRRKSVDRRRTLAISIDTKAAVHLGRLKHDNGTMLCYPGGVYIVLDHDYPLTMRDIYPGGTDLIGEERMDEKAILYPVGVYVLNDNTGYVSLVLGKDNAEAMGNLIFKVIEEKKKTMPKLDSVLILADGGGSNQSGGLQWKDRLLRLANETGMDLEVCHFAPGTSKWDPIEHLMWAQIAIHWKGKPLLDVEHVAAYIEETRTISGLRIKCWFDRRKYLTVKAKLALGEHVITHNELVEEAAGRIEHPYRPEDGDMYKWNYIVHPSSKAKPAADTVKEAC